MATLAVGFLGWLATACPSCHIDCSTKDTLRATGFAIDGVCSAVCPVGSDAVGCDKAYLVGSGSVTAAALSASNVLGRGGNRTLVSVSPSADEAFERAAVRLGLRTQPVWSPSSSLSSSAAAAAAAPRKAKVVDQTPKADLIELLSKEQYETFLRDVSGDREFLWNGVPRTIRTRYTGTDGYSHAVQYFAAECIRMGYRVSTQEFPVRSALSENVICTKQGEGPSDRGTVVVGAHLDSTSQTPTTLAPGANDNGSGAMAVLEMMRASAAAKFRETVHFVAFGGEEQGLYGSNYFVAEAGRQGQKIKSALVMDMISYSNRYYGVTLECDRTTACANLMATAQPNFEQFSKDLEVKTTTISFGSDHVPFQQAGIPCFLAIQLDDTDYPHYHRNTDTVAYANYDQALDIIKGLLATLADEAEIMD